MKGAAISFVLILAVIACTASAEIVMDIVEVDHAGHHELDNYVTRDGEGMIVTVGSPPSIYQDLVIGPDVGWEYPGPSLLIPLAPAPLTTQQERAGSSVDGSADMSCFSLPAEMPPPHVRFSFCRWLLGGRGGVATPPSQGTSLPIAPCWPKQPIARRRDPNRLPG